MIGLLKSVLAIAVWVALARFTANAEDDQAIWRGFTGMIADVQGNSIIVQTSGPTVRLFVDENTKIEAPPGLRCWPTAG